MKYPAGKAYSAELNGLRAKVWKPGVLSRRYSKALPCKSLEPDFVEVSTMPPLALYLRMTFEAAG